MTPRRTGSAAGTRPRRTMCALCLACVALLIGCAFDVVRVEQQPANFVAGTDALPDFTLDATTKVSLGTGYSRQLIAGTRWRHMGAVNAGEVYRTEDQELTVEASNVYEAWIVVRDGSLTGFYLPVENTYSPLGRPLRLSPQPS